MLADTTRTFFRLQRMHWVNDQHQVVGFKIWVRYSNFHRDSSRASRINVLFTCEEVTVARVLDESWLLNQD